MKMTQYRVEVEMDRQGHDREFRINRCWDDLSEDEANQFFEIVEDAARDAFDKIVLLRKQARARDEELAQAQSDLQVAT